MSTIDRIEREKCIERKRVDGHTKMKSIYIGGSFSDGEHISCKCKFFIFVWYLLIYASVFTDRYVIFRYMYIFYGDLVSYIVFHFMIEKDKDIPWQTLWFDNKQCKYQNCCYVF